jgi:hypothetical protein
VINRHRGVSCARVTGGLRRNFIGAALLAVMFGFTPGAARAIDPALCKDDGVTETPDFASRASNGCLMIDPGNGRPAVPFQYETFHKTGVASCDNPRASTTKIDVKFDKHGACRTSGSGQYCSQIIWDTVFDNYLDPGCKNQDVIFFGNGPPWEYLFFKNAVIANGWKCSGGKGWSGPNGIGCAPGEDSEAHSDGIQLRGQPVNGGWFIMQDSVFVNGYNLHFLQQTDSQYGPTGSDLFQGVEIGRRNAVGQASTWIQDCEARRDQSAAEGGDICNPGRVQMGTNNDQVWLIDVYGSTLMGLKGNYNKVVVINTGCGKNGCGGNIGYTDGWPHPLAGAGDGPNMCPNGKIPSTCAGNNNTGPCYCYTSIENMLADKTCTDCPHVPPPFINLSKAGWKIPPSSAGGTRPIPPVLEP